MDQETCSRVALTLIPGIGSSFCRKLITHLGSAEAVFNKNKAQICKIPGLGEKLADTIIGGKKYLEDAKKLIEECSQQKVQLIFEESEEYPPELRQINDNPFLIYFKGNNESLKKKKIAIIGTRQATSYGKGIVQEIITGLNGLNCTIVSGLAYGIDIEAHKFAVDHDISTIGIMANGINKIYPSIHQKIANNMMSNGGIMTEYPPETKPDPQKFPARNRIIAGISDVTIVVEAASKGGALITAEMANGYNREVFAVPGNLQNEFSKGCNNLIRDSKAHIFTSVDDFLDTMGWKLGTTSHETKPLLLHFNELPGMDPVKEKILKILAENESVELDVLSWKSSIPINKLVIQLLELELDGIVSSVPGNKYAINRNRIKTAIRLS